LTKNFLFVLLHKYYGTGQGDVERLYRFFKKPTEQNNKSILKTILYMHFPAFFYFVLSWISTRKRQMRLRHCGAPPKKLVLVLGVYLADRENAIEHIVSAISKSNNFIVDQKWISLLGDPPTHEVARVTVQRRFGRTGKFALMNYLLSCTAWRVYDFVIVCDDDIRVPEGFIDRFLSLQDKLDFALAQPARTHNSYIDHPITEQADESLARETRFVEIGPMTSFRRDMLNLVAPFDESAPMGWGLDFVWPHVAKMHNLRVGIIDATPVEHSMRAPVSTYDGDITRQLMKAFLLKNAHLTKESAFTVLKKHFAES